MSEFCSTTDFVQCYAEDMSEKVSYPDSLLADPEAPMSTEAARFFASITFDDATNARLQLLSEKANEGQLTPEEARELDEFIRLGDRVSVLKMRASMILSERESAA